VVFGTLAVLVIAAFYLPLTLLAPIGGVTGVVAAPAVATQPAASISFPTLGASAIGAVGFDGTLATGGSAEAAPIASITKIITALVVLEAKPLGIGEGGPDITFTQKDVQITAGYRAVNGTVEPVTAGLVLTQREAMDVMLIESANNYAESIATWAYGSVGEFLPVANAWLVSKGLTNTSISDATGMSPKNVSTASDLVALGKLALADPVVSAIVATEAETVPGVGDLENSNDLLGVDGIRGIKTGTLDEAGACLLFAADYVVGGETITLVGVVLGGLTHETINPQVETMLADTLASFHEVKLTTAGEQFASYETAWGETTTAVAGQDESVVVWSDTPVAVATEADEVGLGEKGDEAGEVVFTVGDDTISVPLELSGTLDDPGFWWRLTHPGDLF
jgi:D-alanyl-D-alanine carboxypeptidase (penicillin-binding protein 5/6)